VAQFPTSTSASGVWNLRDSYRYIIDGNWPSPILGDVGFFAGGSTPSNSVVIDFIQISTAGNATDFGDLATAVYGNNNGAVGSTTRGLFAGGGDGTAGGINEISFITLRSKGNATDFGDLSESGRALGAGISSSTRGVFGPRRDSSRPGTSNDNSDTIDYVTISSTGNATDFGNDVEKRANNAGACSSTRGLIAGGNLNTQPGGESTNVISYITIASTGNGTDFGDLTAAKTDPGGAGSSTRAIFAGGNTNPGSAPYGSNVATIDFVTIASTGNASDFGDTQAAGTTRGVSNATKAVYSQSQATPSGAMTTITIASTGNSTTFGDLSVARSKAGTGSSAHGGIQ
tara:strand:+ start:3919 stop:4950 length:1032 start_codon:yes stop_codon:yes gene_type:complete